MGKRLFWIAGGVLFVLMLSRTLNGVWGGDFWAHSACVRELSTHPFSPQHPQLAVDTPAVFYSPYSLGVALGARLFGLGPVAALSVAGMANLVLFLAGISMFTRLAFGNGRTAFYTLIFVLFLWGTDLILFSGFFHFATLGYNLPYPSMFCGGLMFLTLSWSILFFQQGRRRWLAAVFASSAFILLSHPTTAAILFTGMCAVALAYGRMGERARRWDVALFLAIVPASFLVAVFWPYYPFMELLREGAAEFNLENRYIYQKLLQRTFPALALLPLLLLRLKKSKRDFPALMFAGLCALFVYGGMSRAYGYGRALSYMMILLQMIAAAWVAREQARRKWALPAAVCLMVPFLVSGQFRTALRQCLPGYSDTYGSYRFLSDYTGQYDVILSDIRTSWPVPSFGGKIVAALHGTMFVPDHQQRVEDLETFFSARTSMPERTAIMEKYGADFILFNKRAPYWREGASEWALGLGRVAYGDENFLLVKTKK